MELIIIKKIVIISVCFLYGQCLESNLDVAGILDSACPALEWSSRTRHNEIGILSKRLASNARRFKMDSGKTLANILDDTSDSFYSKIKGTWVSERCESRSGPFFVMRRYAFRSSGEFVSRQYRYKDISCSIPSYVISIEGRLATPRPSWLIPGSIEADEPKISKVSILPYSKKSADILTKRIGRFCNREESNVLRRSRFFNVNSRPDFNDGNRSVQSEDDHGYQEAKIECVLRALDWTSSEFQLFRYEVIEDKWYLRLGASSTSARTRPTYFQQTLSKPASCSICNLVGKSKMIRPPILKAKFLLPLYISGIWSSLDCELHSEAVFLDRRIIFKRDQNETNRGTWISKYRYFKDPYCLEILFHLQLSGTFVIGSQSKELIGTTNIDITSGRALITPLNEGFLENLKNAACSVGNLDEPSWSLNRTTDLTPYGGCLALGLLIPGSHYDIVRTEINDEGATILYMGYTDEDEVIGNSPTNRPTFVRFPLASCHPFRSTNDASFNQLHPLSQAFTYYKSQGSKINFFTTIRHDYSLFLLFLISLWNCTCNFV